MSDFEYASVVVSIVLALGIADILRFVADTFRESGSRRLYWLHLLWILILFHLHLEFWWRMWSFRELITIGPSLGMVLLGPALLFVATRALLPFVGADSDLEVLFYKRKTLFFVVFTLLNVWALILSPWSTGLGLEENRGVIIGAFAFVMALFITCIFSSNKLLHGGVAGMVGAFEILDMLAVT